MPETDALAILRRLKAGGDVQDILTQAKGGSLLLQLSLMPQVQRRYELPYLVEIPAFLRVQDNHYLDSLIYRTALKPLEPPRKASPDGSTVSEIQSKYMTPFHAATLVEPLLIKATASRWTTVIADDELFRQLLGAFFIFIYPSWYPLHKNLFLEDLAAGRTQFCSPLLVNVLLAAGFTSCCHMPDRTRYWLPINLGYKFTAEANRLWQIERSGKVHLTTIQAAIILTTVISFNGLDRVGTKYLEQALLMAHEISLFDAPADSEKDDVRKARTVTAWALYSFQTRYQYHYQQPPYVNEPPKLRLPDPVAYPEWYGETWVRYPETKH
jgi:hypothetical protein